MRRSIFKAIIAGLATLAMAATLLSTTAPVLAGGFHGGFGGFRPGFGGFHSGFGGFRPGFVGFHPGFGHGFVAFHHPGFRSAFVGRRFFFHPGFFRNGVWINGWWGPAVVAGAWWGASYGGCWSYQPTYDAWGNYQGYSYVNLCS
jgi:hypothetical protein